MNDITVSNLYNAYAHRNPDEPRLKDRNVYDVTKSERNVTHMVRIDSIARNDDGEFVLYLANGEDKFVEPNYVVQWTLSDSEAHIADVIQRAAEALKSKKSGGITP